MKEINKKIREAMKENERCDALALENLGYKSIEDFINEKIK